MKKSIFLLILAVLITGCGGNIFEALEDKNTKEGIDFQISRDVDAGNWEAVLKQCPDPDDVSASGEASAMDCAAAAMGLAGFDITDIVTALAGMDNSSTTSDLRTFADISMNPDAIDELSDAKKMLLLALEESPDDPDLSYQLVMLSLVDIATQLAYGVREVDGNTENGITQEDAQTLAGNDTVINNIVGDVTEDVANILNSITAAGVSADVADSITAIISGDVNNPGINYDGSDDNVVSADDLKNYLTYELGAE